MTVRQALVSQVRICRSQEGSHSRKRQHEEGETVELQTEEAGTEQQGGTGGNTEGEDVDMIMTYTKPNQPDPK